MDAALKKRGFEDNSEQLVLKYTAESREGGCQCLHCLPFSL